MAVPDKHLTLFHMNVSTLLYCLNANFYVISLSEIRTSVGNQIKTNTELPGYNFHNIPLQSSAGGVGLYVKTDLTLIKRDDLCTSDEDFETVWIEIVNSNTKNLLFCCIYRHPRSDISKFSDHLQMTLSNVEKENKLVSIMGDLNIDLLKYDNNTPSNDVINMMFAYHLQPSTSSADSSSTIIDNIYVNNASASNIFAGNIFSRISDCCVVQRSQ